MNSTESNVPSELLWERDSPIATDYASFSTVDGRSKSVNVNAAEELRAIFIFSKVSYLSIIYSNDLLYDFTSFKIAERL